MALSIDQTKIRIVTGTDFSITIQRSTKDKIQIFEFYFFSFRLYRPSGKLISKAKKFRKLNFILSTNCAT